MHNCKYCTRSFAGKRALTEHEVGCSYNTTEMSTQQQVEELQKKIKELTKIVKRLEVSVNYLSKQRKKIEKPPIEFLLKQKFREPKKYNNWMKEINISVQNMTYLFQYKYVEGIINILKANLNDIAPIKSHKKVLYFYKNDEWKKMEKSDISSLITHIQSKIAGGFLKWQKENPDIVNNNTDGIFEKNMIEAFGGKKTKETNDRQIQNKLFSLCEIKSFV